jgi:hypothetical protein
MDGAMITTLEAFGSRVRTEKQKRRSVKNRPKRAKGVALEISLAAMSGGSNISWKATGSFPSYNRCDSLLFFPATFTNCLNSGDFVSLNKLIHSRIDQNCEFKLAESRISLEGMLIVLELMNDLHPDSVHFVHTTKVVGNQIRASMCYKYTDNMKLRQALAGTFPDTRIFKACAGPRGDPEQRTQYVNNRPDDEKADILYNLAFAEEVVVYGNSYMTLTFDDYSKKVIALSLGCEFTSFRVV